MYKKRFKISSPTSKRAEKGWICQWKINKTVSSQRVVQRYFSPPFRKSNYFSWSKLGLNYCFKIKQLLINYLACLERFFSAGKKRWGIYLSLCLPLKFHLACHRIEVLVFSQPIAHRWVNLYPRLRFDESWTTALCKMRSLFKEAHWVAPKTSIFWSIPTLYINYLLEVYIFCSKFSIRNAIFKHVFKSF